MIFRGKCGVSEMIFRLKRLLPYGSMLVKTKKKANIQNPKFHNALNTFGRDPP